MRILLIGNGFALEHGLPTSYRDSLEFCIRVKKIYTGTINTPPEYYYSENLEHWKINSSIKPSLLSAFKSRKLNQAQAGDGSSYTLYSTFNPQLNELYALIKDNIWFEFFITQYSSLGQNWIDFEYEISKAIQALHFARELLISGGLKEWVLHQNGAYAEKILRSSNQSFDAVFNNISSVDSFTVSLNADLDKLIRALEIYISCFVEKIPIEKKNADIEEISPTHVLSFNFSNTYKRVYGADNSIIYDYIHGKADADKDEKTSNLVLGIDEYLDDGRKDKELEFLPFKKFYQRIYKSTDNQYLSWIDKIHTDYAKHLKTQELIKNLMPATSIDPALCHTLYIFGHSLDITDRDVLGKLICNDNVMTKIYYHRRSEADKSSLGKQIQNLVRIIGQDELIRRTGGTTRTIEFIPQALSH